MKQRCLSFNVKVLNKAKYNLPWMKAGSQTTKHTAIRPYPVVAGHCSSPRHCCFVASINLELFCR